MGRFDNFTERARNVLRFSQEEAQRLGQARVDTEHLLLGLIRESEGVAAKVLANLGLDLERTRQAVELRVSSATEPGANLGLTDAVKQVIEISVAEARRLDHHYIGTEHLLLGLVRLEAGGAAEVLRWFEVSADVVREQLSAILRESAAYAQSEAGRAGGKRFDRFTEEARKVLQLSQEEAHRFNHNYIGTEHLLLGLLCEEQGVAARALTSMGVELAAVRNAVEFIIGRGDRTVTGDIGLTPRAKKVIELSVDEARRLNHHYIGTEHLLLGLVREGEGIAVGVLESLGASPAALRERVQLLLKDPGVHLPRRAGPRVARMAIGRAMGEAAALVANKGTVRVYYEAVLTEGRLELIDELFAETFVSHPQAGDLAGFKQAVAITRAGFPDLHVEIEDQVAEGDRVVTRWTARGTHTGPFLGQAPTGQAVTVSAIQIHRLADGKITDLWEQLDLLGLMQQLGGLPPAGG